MNNGIESGVRRIFHILFVVLIVPKSLLNSRTHTIMKPASLMIFYFYSTLKKAAHELSKEIIVVIRKIFMFHFPCP